MNKRWTITGAACLLVLASPAYAKNGWQHLIKMLRSKAPATLPAQAKPSIQKYPSVQALPAAANPSILPALSASLPGIHSLQQQHISQAVNLSVAAAQAKQYAQQKQAMAAFDAYALQSIGVLRNPLLQILVPLEATAFFIEAEYQGEKTILGVTAAHMIDFLGPDMLVRITPAEGLGMDFPITVLAKGNAGLADIALFKVNEDISDFVRPLSLGEGEVRPGENLRSYSFFEKELHIIPNRRVLAATPSRLVTSFEFGKHDRAGACGGPLLNEQNELVGIHCGSSLSKQESYAVPVSFLKDLLAAAQHHNQKTRPLVWNGKVVGQINIDEYIYSVSLKQFGFSPRTFSPWHDEEKVDYAHLEKIFPLAQDGIVEIHLIQGGTLQTGHTEGARQRILTLNLRTGETAQKPLHL